MPTRREFFYMIGGATSAGVLSKYLREKCSEEVRNNLVAGGKFTLVPVSNDPNEKPYALVIGKQNKISNQEGFKFSSPEILDPTYGLPRLIFTPQLIVDHLVSHRLNQAKVFQFNRHGQSMYELPWNSNGDARFSLFCFKREVYEGKWADVTSLVSPDGIREVRFIDFDLDQSTKGIVNRLELTGENFTDRMNLDSRFYTDAQKSITISRNGLRSLVNFS